MCISLGWVPLHMLIALMSSAVAVLFRSTWVGYGLLAVEGVAYGVPVVESRASTPSKATESVAMLVDTSSEDLANGLRRAPACVNGRRLERTNKVAQARKWETVSTPLRLYKCLWYRA